MHKPKPILKGKKVIKLRLIKEYDANHSRQFPTTLKVGDITWVYKSDLHINSKINIKYENYCLIEGNIYGGNFNFDYFEIVRDEPQYEIY